MNAPCFEPVSVNAASLEQGLRSMGNGGMAVIAHDAASETGGAIVMAAEAATPERLAFLGRETGGLIRVALPLERAAKLHLAKGRAVSERPCQVSPCETVDYRYARPNGPLAVDRALTARKLVAPDVSASDFVRPGHVPIVYAVEGGVLVRDGFAEAAVDLARLAGCRAGALLCDIATADGRPAQKADLKRLAARHGLTMIEADQIVAYRRATEPLVERIASRRVMTKYGELNAVGYRHRFGGGQLLALMPSACPSMQRGILHVHSQCVTGEVLGSLACRCASRLDAALAAVASVPDNCLIYVYRHAGWRNISMYPCNGSHDCFGLRKESLHSIPKEVRDVLHDLINSKTNRSP